MARVSTTKMKCSPGYVRTRKVLEDVDLESLKTKVQNYLGKDRNRVEIIVREHRYAAR
ncbi:MAG: hypothetical protein WBB28_01445 [Crinalium sp.]